MADSLSLEERVAKLEQELALLKSHAPPSEKRAQWPWNVCGSMKDIPEFDEVLRLGQEFRQSYRDHLDDEEEK